MALIDDFIARYRKEYDYYNQVARSIAQTLETNLQAAGMLFATIAAQATGAQNAS